MKNKKMKNGEFRKFESFEEMKSTKSETPSTLSEKDFIKLLEELQKNTVPNENLKKAVKKYKNYIARMM